MKTAAAWTVALLLCACSAGESQTAQAPAPSMPTAAPPAPPPPRAAVVAAPAPAECATLRSPHSFAKVPLEVVTASGTTTFQVEIADSEAERQYGYMCRTNVPPGEGMLFQFDEEQPQAFWMRNTLVPLDIIFINRAGRVVSIGRNARPLDDSGVPSGAPAIGVLELAGGRAAEIGLLPGDQVKHPFFKP